MFEEEEILSRRRCLQSSSELIAYLGRFKYRFSYGQNLIAHTLEETKIGIKLAHEVGANVDIVKLGCLLHDIGKVVNDENSSHVELVKLLKKYKCRKQSSILAQHHEDEPFGGVEQVLVYIADAISAHDLVLDMKIMTSMWLD
jgi:ribonuclease Y